MHSIKADLWSLGIVLYYLCYSRVPFIQLDNIEELRVEIINLRLERSDFEENERVTSEMIDVMLDLLMVERSKRYSFQVIKSKYLSFHRVMIENIIQKVLHHQK